MFRLVFEYFTLKLQGLISAAGVAQLTPTEKYQPQQSYFIVLCYWHADVIVFFKITGI
jgi:hypothetical protein